MISIGRTYWLCLIFISLTIARPIQIVGGETTNIYSETQNPTPAQAVFKFYSWYLTATTNGSIYRLVNVENQGGNAGLGYQPYLDSLEKLKVFHRDFFLKEISKFEECDSFLNKYIWSQYQADEPSYSGYCDFLDYHVWFMTQEPVNDIDTMKSTIKGDNAVVSLMGYDIERGKKIPMTHEIQVTLVREDEKWLITNIK